VHTQAAERVYDWGGECENSEFQYFSKKANMITCHRWRGESLLWGRWIRITWYRWRSESLPWGRGIRKSKA